MSRKVSPECKRMVMATAAKEGLQYIPAMEFLILEGYKAVNDDDPKGAVYKPVDNGGINQ